MSSAANESDERQTCTICVESVVVESMERSSARLRCGHYFHLDCIGSAFNLRGKMQCPNCRIEEDGEWHYGTVQVFRGRSNVAAPNVEQPQSFDLTAEELHNFMVNGLPEDIPEYLRSRGPRTGERQGSITLSRVILSPISSQATGSARAGPNLGPRPDSTYRGGSPFNNGN